MNATPFSPYALCNCNAALDPITSDEALEAFEDLHLLTCGWDAVWVHTSESAWRNAGRTWELGKLSSAEFTSVYRLK